jgi:transposase InsO family protein
MMMGCLSRMSRKLSCTVLRRGKGSNPFSLVDYTSSGYFNLTKEYGVTPSMSRRGNCYGNALAENFFGILKSECIYRSSPKTFEQVRQPIDEYVHFYNNERFQLKIKLTPLEKRCQFA